MATIVRSSTEPRILLRDVRWPTYESLLADLSEQHVRLTYDRGSLEIMSPSPEHERYTRLLGRLIAVLTEELEIPMDGLGSMTCRRQDLRRGLEPDDCYYFRNEPLVRGKNELDFTIDPPPDLAIEVEISESSLNKLELYAALGVPEVWRFDGESLRIHRLRADGTYAPSLISPIFPTLPPAEIVRFVQLSSSMDKTSWIKAFRAWVRKHLVPHHPGPIDG